MTFRTGAYPEVIAHRGGSKERPENTCTAFEHAYALGVRTMETDLHLTRDGVLVCHHDETVDRTTSGNGAVSSLTLAELSALDAGHTFTTDGHTFPFRGRGVRIPTLEEALASCPDARFILELKTEGPAMARAVFDFLSGHEAASRVCVASFHDATLEVFRSLAKGTIRVSAGRTKLATFWAITKLPLALVPKPPFPMMQVPVEHNGIPIVTPRLVRAAHARGVEVQVWTIDDAPEMRRLLDLGVDAIITDTPERAIGVISGRRAAP